MKFITKNNNKILLMKVCGGYAYQIGPKVVEEYKADKRHRYDQKINHTKALSMTQDIMIAVFI